MPVAHANARSPSWRVCDGWMARARPWLALRASRWHSTFVHLALVATTTSVVLVPPTPPSGRRLERGLLREAGDVGRRLRGHEGRAVGLEHVADRVHDDERGDDDLAVTRRRGADASGGAVFPPAPLRDARPPAGAHPSGGERRRVRIEGSGVRGPTLVGTGTFVARDHEVEDRRRRDDRYRTTASGEAAPEFGERAHDPVGGREPECRSAGEHDGIDVLDAGEGIEHRGLPRRRRAAADLDRADGLGREHHDGHPRGRAGPVPGEHAGNVGDHVSRRWRTRRPRRHRSRRRRRSP